MKAKKRPVSQRQSRPFPEYMKAPYKLIVGLGNPGPVYRRTRHNAGAMAVERFAKKIGFSFKPSRSLRSFLALGEHAGNELILFLPQTFMNLSGEAVAEVVRKKRIALCDILAVYDDIALALGEIRLKASGGSGGHKPA